MKIIDENFEYWQHFAKSKPVIVCIPVFNGELYLMECLQSLVKQTFADFSVLVIDNASTDRTSNICLNFQDNRFFYKRNIENVGAIGNHNICLDHAMAKYIKILSADDVLLPETLERQVNAVENDDTIGLVSCNLIETDEKLNSRGVIKFFTGTALGADVIRKCTTHAQNYIGGPSNTLIRVSCIEGRRFQFGKKWLADLDFHSEIIKYKKYSNINTEGFLYRRHFSADSFLSCPPHMRLMNEFWYIKKYNGPYVAYIRVVVRYLKNLYLARINKGNF